MWHWLSHVLTFIAFLFILAIIVLLLVKFSDDPVKDIGSLLFALA
jgi:hypothetical protein